MATSTGILAVPVRRRSPQDITARAHKVLDAALSVADLWPGKGAAQAAADLNEALENYQAAESRAIGWEAFYPHLSAAADPHGEALEKLAEECAYGEGALLMAIAAIGGTAVADGIWKVATGGTE